jgi:hypothetical protein
MSPRDMLTKGALLLERALKPHRYSFLFREDGQGSGGHFATGDFIRGDRRLELHFRQSLGLVAYHVGDACVSHAGYMEELGVRERSAYPGFSDEPLDGFRHLADDIERFGEDFLMGDGAIVIRAAAREKALNESKSRALEAGYAGDNRVRAEAKRRFDARDWKSVVSLLDSLQYPEQMDAADRRRLEIARRRAVAS